MLVEKRLDIEQEYFLAIIIDDSSKAPLAIFSSRGGTGIEEIAKEYPSQVAKKRIEIKRGLLEHEAREMVSSTGIKGKDMVQLGAILSRLYRLARDYEARSAEINPLVKTKEGKFFAVDCRIAVDDYAVFRHKELGIEIAREFAHPPTPLDIIAYRVEEGDHRGTFYFIQLEEGYKRGEGYIGFHGAGGGGSMMSMNALLASGFKLANFCDTSGNPPASKVYRAARIILAQGPIDGYFASGSGVASQEQFHSARGLIKAFREINPGIPAVIRLGGNMEEKAIKILEEYSKGLKAPIEAYGKDTSATFCAKRLEILLKEHPFSGQGRSLYIKREPKIPYSFKTITKGEVIFDHALCEECKTHICVAECVPRILKLEHGRPVLAISREETEGGKCIECLACEIECEFLGNKGARVNLPIGGLESYGYTY